MGFEEATWWVNFQPEKRYAEVIQVMDGGQRACIQLRDADKRLLREQTISYADFSLEVWSPLRDAPVTTYSDRD